MNGIDYIKVYIFLWRKDTNEWLEKNVLKKLWF